MSRHPLQVRPVRAPRLQAKGPMSEVAARLRDASATRRIVVGGPCSLPVDGRNPVLPGAGLLELRGESDQEVLAAVRGGELDADGQAVLVPEQRERDGRLAGGVEQRGER